MLLITGPLLGESTDQSLQIACNSKLICFVFSYMLEKDVKQTDELSVTSNVVMLVPPASNEGHFTRIKRYSAMRISQFVI